MYVINEKNCKLIGIMVYMNIYNRYFKKKIFHCLLRCFYVLLFKYKSITIARIRYFYEEYENHLLHIIDLKIY